MTSRCPLRGKIGNIETASPAICLLQGPAALIMQGVEIVAMRGDNGADCILLVKLDGKHFCMVKDR